MSAHSEAVVRSLGFLFEQGTHCGLSDAELLERFRSRSDDAAAHAFEGLVLRHGPMVFDVCNKVLDNAHDAQDAFQATFLILATRARSIRRQTSVGSWLHGVALRVARRARSDAARRRVHERRIAEMTGYEAHRGNHARRWRLSAPPRGGRAAAADVPRAGRALLPRGPVAGGGGRTARLSGQHVGVRLMRARGRLKARLTRRGISRADGLLIAGPAAGTGPAVLPGSLVRDTVGLAVRRASGGAVPMAVAQLTNGVSRSMAMIRLAQVFAGILMAMAAIGSSGAVLGRPGQQAADKPANRPAGDVPESCDRPRRRRARIRPRRKPPPVRQCSRAAWWILRAAPPPASRCCSRARRTRFQRPGARAGDVRGGRAVPDRDPRRNGFRSRPTIPWRSGLTTRSWGSPGRRSRGRHPRRRGRCD